MQSRIHAQPLSAAQASVHLFTANPLVLLAGAFTCGVFGGLYLAVPISHSISTTGLLSLLAATSLLKRKTRLATTLITLTMLLVGFVLASIEKNYVPANQLKRVLTERSGIVGEGTIAVGDPVEVTGVLQRDPELAQGRLYMFLKVQELRYRGTVRDVSGEVVLLAPISNTSVEQTFADLDLRYGARIRAMTTLERSDSFRNPGVSSFTEYLDRKGYDATGLVKSPLLIERLENQRVFLPLAWLYEWRRLLQREIDLHFSKETAGVLDAAFLGNRYNLSHNAAERFREAGTFHVLVISGLHITFLGGLVFLIAKRFTKNTTLQFLLSVSVLWAFAIAVGGEVSVVRAALMFTMILLAPLISRRASSLNALGGVGIALLVWRPSDLLDPSFQLTFLSVLAIVTLAWPLLQKLSTVGSWRPTRETPYPPSCALWLRSFCESLYWNPRQAQRELAKTNYSYKLFKAPLAADLERLHLQRPLRYGFSAIVVSAGVQLALLPFLIVYFHRLSLASFLLNIGVSILMGGLAVTAATGLAIGLISTTLAVPFIGFANALNLLMVHSVDPFLRMGIASVRLPEYTGWAAAVYVLYYVPFTMLAVSLWRWKPLKLQEADQTQRSFAKPWRLDQCETTNQTPKNLKILAKTIAKACTRRGRITKLALLAQLFAIGVIVFHPWSAAKPKGILQVDFLDVGQGDSALVSFPDNTTLLIDGGGKPWPFKSTISGEDMETEEEDQFARDGRSIGEAVVSEYLWWRGLDHIDYILATHADADHIDGLNDIARNFTVRAAIVARTPSRDPEYSRFSDTLSARGIPIRIIGAGDEMRFGEVSVSVLWPLASSTPNLPSGNNDSVVLRVQFGDRSMLLTGDIEAPAEEAILKAIGNRRENLKADIVKVAHHGSKSSSTPAFTVITHPSYAIISVGQTSMFGHPNPAIVERWKAVGSQVLTTGRSGMITVITDGTDLRLTSFITTGSDGFNSQQFRAPVTLR